MYFLVSVEDKLTDYHLEMTNSQNGVPAGKSGSFKYRINCVLVNTLACIFLSCRHKVFALEGFHIKQRRPNFPWQRATTITVGWFRGHAPINHKWCTQQPKLLCNIYIYIYIYIYIHTHTPSPRLGERRGVYRVLVERP
jgi:hypothetical protein